MPEHEFGGTIVAMGEGGRDGTYVFASADADDSEDSEDWNLRVGDQVLGFLPFSERLKGHGAMAEYIVCPMEHVVRKPRNQSLLEASGVLANGWTAVHSGDAAGIKKGDKVLLNGCSGLLGSLMVQVLKGIVGEEGTVVGVCSAKNEAFVKGLGVDEVRLISAAPNPSPPAGFSESTTLENLGSSKTGELTTSRSSTTPPLAPCTPTSHPTQRTP